MRPNFFIIGASKCATTSFWDILKKHKDIFLPEIKEPNFFIKDNYKCIENEYLKLFEKATKEIAIGEVSPVYSETTIFPKVPKRIYEFNNNSKIIYIVREPISRIHSVYKQTMSTGHWYRNVYKEVFEKEDIGFMNKNIEKAVYNYPPYIEASKYWTQIQNYRKYFPDDNILLLFFEDFKNNPAETIKKTLSFLNVNQNIKLENIDKPRNSSLEKNQKTSFYLFLNKTRINHLLKYIIPNSIFKLFSKKLKNKSLNNIKRLSTWHQNRIKSILSEETTNILTYGNKPLDFWD